MAAVELPPWLSDISLDWAVKLWLYGIYGNTPPTAGSGGLPVVPSGSDAGKVQGTAANNAAASGNPVQTGGVAVTGSTYAPAYAEGDQTVLATDKDNGGVLCDIRKLTRSDDHVSADPGQYTASSNAAIGTAAETVFTLTAGQSGLIQNLDDVALFVKYGTGASTSSFTFILPACSTALDGTSPPVKIDDWIGPVSVAPATGTASYLATVFF